MKGYKVSDAKRIRTVGVACCTLLELKLKGKKKLNIVEHVRIQLLDGTFVDDEEYFETLPAQTIFLLLKPGEIAETGAKILYSALEAVNLDYLRAGHEAENFFTKNVKEKLIFLAKLINKTQDNKTKTSKKVDDPEWFVGVDSRSVTKEEFMARRSQDRIRGYLYKTQDDIRKTEEFQNDPVFRKKLSDSLQKMTQQLKMDRYFADYFDRRAQARRLCDEIGEFYCRGRWNLPCCQYKDGLANKHLINPYASREARIVFSTWNLDHIVERSRTIIPAMLKAANLSSMNKCEINYSYFYKLLFTTDNLKLVHIVCHDKGAHTVECDIRIAIN